MYFNVISYPSSIARIIRDFCSFSWKPDITLVWAGNKIWCNQSDWNFYQKYISSRPHIAENFRSKGPTEVKSHFWWGMGVEQGGKSEVSILQRTPCTPRLCPSYPSELFSIKSTTNLWYGIWARLQPTQFDLTIKPKYFTVLPVGSTIVVQRSIVSLLSDRIALAVLWLIYRITGW